MTRAKNNGSWQTDTQQQHQRWPDKWPGRITLDNNTYQLICKQVSDLNCWTTNLKQLFTITINNKAIVDSMLRLLCTPIPLSRPIMHFQWGRNPFLAIAMQPIVNMSDWATDTGNMHKKFGKDRTCGSRDILMDRQTDRQTHTLITVLHNCSRGQSNNQQTLD